MARFLLALVAVLFCGLSASAHAEPDKVTVGIYMNQITGLNLRENQVNVDFYIWFRWTDDSINPLESFELMNGTVSTKTPTPVRKIKGENYGQARIQAVLNQPWDVSRFPLDSQTIRIEIEDNDSTADKITYLPDTENSQVSNEISLPGYQMNGVDTNVRSHLYHTNYGDISLPRDAESVYSRFNFDIRIGRPDSTYFLKTFSTIFISSMVAFLAFLVKPVDLDPRFGLGVGALFAVVASYFIIAGDLPRSSGFTLADKVNMLSMGVIFLSLLQSAISLMIYERNQAYSLRLDRASIIVFPIAYALLCMWLMMA